MIQIWLIFSYVLKLLKVLNVAIVNELVHIKRVVNLDISCCTSLYTSTEKSARESGLFLFPLRKGYGEVDGI